MRSALAYAPRPGPLGAARPLVAAAYLGPLAALAFVVSNPLLLAAVGAAAVLVARASAAGGALHAPLRWALALAVLIVAVNALVARRGETILLRGWELPALGRVEVSAEALAEGAVLGLRVLVALLVFAVWSACVNPDRVLRGIRPYAARSALTATLVARMVPLAAADAARLTEAASLRGPAAAPVGRAALARRLIAGSLDRAVDAAATLELRGYGLPCRPARPPRRSLEPGERSLLGAGALLVALGVAAIVAGVASFDAYPTVSVDLGPAAWALAAAIPIAATLPFIASRRPRRPSIEGFHGL